MDTETNLGIAKEQNFSNKTYYCSYLQGSHSDWKTWKNGKTFSSQGILNRREKSGKITENTGKARKFETNFIYYFSDI